MVQNLSGSAPHELVIERISDAPSTLVWRADGTGARETVVGPAAFTAPVIKIDFRVGGKYHWLMRNGDGKEFWTTGVYQEIVPLERIVLTQSMADEHGNVASAGMPGGMSMETMITVTFEERDGKTVITVRQSGFPAAEMSEGAAGGWNESLDKLAAALGALA